MTSSRPRLTVFYEEWKLHLDGVGMEKLENGALFPNRWSAHVLVDDGPWWLELDLAVQDGTPMLKRFDLHLGPLDADSGASMPLALTRQLAQKWVIDEVIRQGSKWVAYYEQNERRELEQIGEHGSAARRGRPPTTERLRLVGDIARENPMAPTKAVAEQLKIAHRTATRWISLARSAGFLD